MSWAHWLSGGRGIDPVSADHVDRERFGRGNDTGEPFEGTDEFRFAPLLVACGQAPQGRSGE